MSRSETIKQLWQRVYSITQAQTKAQTYGGHLSLPPKFDQELLNDIAGLQEGVSKEKVADIRGKISIAGTTGLIGQADVEELEHLLDQLAEDKGE